MNLIVENELDIIKETMKLKDQLLDLLTDELLGKNLGGKTMSLGELCKEMGETEQIYIDSLRSFKMNWGYKYADNSVASSVTALRAWNQKLDADLFAAIESLSNEDIETKLIDRGGFMPNPHVQLHVWREAILIFCAKVSIYLRAMNIEFPEQWKYWIA